jgi:hypothetical protein
VQQLAGEALVSGSESCGGNEVTAGAHAKREDASRIDVEVGGLGLQPSNGRVNVVQCCWVGMLGGQAVIGGKDLGLCDFGEIGNHVEADVDAAGHQAATKSEDGRPLRRLSTLLDAEGHEACDVKTGPVSRSGRADTCGHAVWEGQRIGSSLRCRVGCVPDGVYVCRGCCRRGHLAAEQRPVVRIDKKGGRAMVKRVTTKQSKPALHRIFLYPRENLAPGK